jgi:acyl-ACP thioesterase
MEKEKNLYTRPIKVHSYHTDFRGKLAIPSLFAFFQEIAWEHATKHSFGYEDLKDHGLFWVLARIHVEITELPNWTDSLNLSTWPSGIDSLFALRDYLITDMNGNKIIAATSSWLIIDLKNRRPHRPDSLKDRMPICESIRATSTNAQKIQSFKENIVNVRDYKVGICDLDVNGHINNIKYAEWAVNSFLIHDYKQFDIDEMDINFISEGFYNDECVISTSKIDDKTYITSISRKLDGKELAIVRTVTRRR